MAKTVVVLGGAFGGLHVAHYLLKNDKDVKVILVTKNSHFYWCLASVRAIIPDQLQESQYFGSLETALGRYPKERVELVLGAAASVDVEKKTVGVQVAGTTAGELRSIAYDHLVLATGSRTQVPADAPTAAGSISPWKGFGSYEEDKAALDAARERVTAAKHVVVAGGGSTGIEVASEIGFAYGGSGEKNKKIVLLSSGDALLSGKEPKVAKAALAELKKLHVEVRTNAKVTASRVLEDGRVELTLASEAEPLVTDAYLTTYGLTPNTEYLDASLLAEDKKHVAVDEFYRVKGVSTNDVWAVGDVVGTPREGFMITQKQAAGVGKNVVLALAGKPPAPVKLLPVDVLAVATGRSRGVGRINSMGMPSFMVWAAKGRTLGTQYLPSYLDGSIA